MLVAPHSLSTTPLGLIEPAVVPHDPTTSSPTTSPAAAASTEGADLPPGLTQHWRKITGRLGRISRIAWIGFVVCLVLSGLIELIPNAIGVFPLAWIRASLASIVSSFLGVAVIAMVLDYFDLTNDFTGMQDTIKELLETVEKQGKISAAVEAELSKPRNDGSPDLAHDPAALAQVIRDNYDLGDADASTDTTAPDSFLKEIERKVGLQQTPSQNA